MEYRTLGRTGIKVSPYGLGTLMFATSIGNPDPDDSIRVIHRALDAGINLVDTADAYGDSEEIVGKALKGRRDSVVLATKFSRPMGDDPNRQGTSRRWIMTAVEESLRRLQTDHIDLYQVQRLDPTTDIEETLSALSRPDPQREGARDRLVDDARLRHRRGPMGRRASRSGAVPHRAAAVLDPQPRHRARGASGRAALRHGHARMGPARAGPAHRPRPQGPSTTTCAGAACSVISTTSAASTRSSGSIPLAAGGGPADDAPRDGLRDRPPRRHQRADRAAHDGTPRRPARGHRRRAQRRHPRPHRRDRPARHRRRHARPGVRAPALGQPEPPPPARPSARRDAPAVGVAGEEFAWPLSRRAGSSSRPPARPEHAGAKSALSNTR